MRRRWLGAGLVGLAVLAALGSAALQWRKATRAEASLRQRLAQIVPPGSGGELPCLAPGANRPLVLLALGQSNAANHGSATTSGAPLTVFTEAGDCRRVGDPLPGGTGTGASIWTRLPSALAEAGEHRPLVLALLAVDASSVHEWTSDGSPLAQRLDSLARNMVQRGLQPDLVLWQQGEADARGQTAPASYGAGLQALATHLQAAGVRAPILLARSTVCRSAPAPGLRAVLQSLAANDRRFGAGPDTDTELTATMRSDGCHLAESGLQAAARSWAQAVVAQLR